MRKPDKIQQIIDQINRVKHSLREEEISFYGKTLRYSSIVKSKKIYNRKTKHKKKIEDYD